MYRAFADQFEKRARILEENDTPKAAALKWQRGRFLPGLGTLYVNPKTLPAGPFLAYDHRGKLVSTVYMIPIKDITDQKEFEDLPSPGGKVDHVDMYFNAGHPGVPVPHYHIVLWHVSKQQESLVAK